MSHQGYRVLVFGGAKGMGLWIADFLARSGHEITIADIDKETPKIAVTRNFKGVVLTKGDRYLTPVLTNDGYCDCDVAVIAVTINVTPDVIRQVGPRLRAGSLLMDVTSVKNPAMQAMDEAASPGVGVLGTHPMFGPDALSFFGQTCIIVPSQIHPPERWLEWWTHLLKQEGALYTTSTAEKHDQMMLVVQVLLHYVLICFGMALPMVGVNLNQADSFKSPMYEITMGLVSRIFSQPPDTYYWIQKHPDGETVRNLFIQCSNKICDTFKKSTLPQYNKLRLDIREAIGETNVAAYSSIAAAIIRERANQRKTLLKAEGKTTCIENVESKKIHYGIVREVSPNAVTIETLIKNRETVQISLKKARLLSPEETNKWKLQCLPLKRMTLSFLAPQEANPQVITSLASNRFGVEKVAVVDIYSSPKIMTGKKKITLAITVTTDQEGEAAYSEIRKLLEGIGCVMIL